MKRLGRLPSLLVLATTMLLLSASTVSADCTTEMQSPESPAAAVGTTFTGAIVDFVTEVGDPEIVGRYTIDVDRVYAGDVSDSIVITAYKCHGLLGLEGGRPLLFSTSDLERPNPVDSVVWYVGDDGRLELVGFEARPADHTLSIRNIETLDEALRALRADGLPETASLGLRTGRSGIPSGMLFLIMGSLAILGSLAFVRRRPQRYHRAGTGSRSAGAKTRS